MPMIFLSADRALEAPGRLLTKGEFPPASACCPPPAHDSIRVIRLTGFESQSLLSFPLGCVKLPWWARVYEPCIRLTIISSIAVLHNPCFDLASLIAEPTRIPIPHLMFDVVILPPLLGSRGHKGLKKFSLQSSQAGDWVTPAISACLQCPPLHNCLRFRIRDTQCYRCVCFCLIAGCSNTR